MDYHLSKRTDDVEIPDSIKMILQALEDERRWKKLEEVRRAVLCVVEGETVVAISHSIRSENPDFDALALDCFIAAQGDPCTR